jgi:hypothetical protein
MRTPTTTLLRTEDAFKNRLEKESLLNPTNTFIVRNQNKKKKKKRHQKTLNIS